jgi:tetratricopeptide (TPR) repeat protein
MTFQGDVGGIGLADLLQSLARGRDGILTLIGREGLQATLGIEDGLIHLLADPSEDPDLWRERAKAAWAGDPNSRIDSVRMTEIARAHRIELVYRLLDSDTVHFRFAPGPLPKAPREPAVSKAETGFSKPGSRRDGVWCAPIAVDALLLEYARLKDEAAGLGPAFDLSEHTVLCLLDPSLAEGDMARFAAECDAASNLQEIADRLGWALRQMRIVTAVAIAHGKLREAQAHELLNLAQRELLQGNSARAASRLIGWYECAPAGLLAEQDAEFLAHEWNAGRLQAALRAMPRSAARAVLRRVDSVLFNPVASAERWKEFARNSQPDPIANLRVLVCQVRSGSEEGLPPIRDLLSAARSFNERKQPLRAAAILRVAAERQPETTAMRLELGQGLLHAGLSEEGGPWILEAARALIDEKQGDKALAPLRTLIEQNPSNREARRLFSRARAVAMRRKLTGRHAVLIAAAIVALGIMGWVRVGSRRDLERKLTAVSARMSDPPAALALLEKEFPGDTSEPVEKLRRTIEERRRSGQVAARSSWIVEYRDAQAECTGGDPLLGLRRAMDLPPSPQALDDRDPLPVLSDLFNTLAARGESALRELSDGIEDQKDQVHAEQHVAKLLADLKAEMTGRERTPEVRELDKRLDDLQVRLERRAEERAAARADHLKRENQARQDLLLAAARAHAQAGDHSRSMTAYQQLVESDDTGKLKVLLAKEISAEEGRHSAVLRARELASAGKQAQAKSVLAAALDNVGDYLLPWRVETIPTGARARFKDGTERVTPFTLESAFGEHITMSFEREGCEPATLSVDDPADRMLYLSRAPERAWHPKGRIEALPLAVGEDHVVCDRAGTVARLSRDGAIIWQRELSSLGGIARTPALLPKQRGKLVILSEDGQAWLCEAASGELEGPFAIGSTPIEGPFPCLDGVRARFRDGRMALWSTGLTPEISVAGAGDGGSGDCPGQEGAVASMAVLRRRASAALTLKSPWTDWTVEVGEKACTLRAPGEDKPSVSVRREGAWTYVAWEAPHAQMPRGRLWIADGLGLRSYLP